MSRRLGYRRDLGDFRDKMFGAVSPAVVAAQPMYVDLRTQPQMPPVYDQGDIESCVGNAVACAVQWDMAQGQVFNPSRLWIYYKARQLEGTVEMDAGCTIRDAMKAINTFGICSELDWPYDETKVNDFPPEFVDGKAQLHKAVVYSRAVQTEFSLCDIIASSYPVVAGFSIYSSFMTDVVAKAGIAVLPASDETQLGGHAMTIVGYDKKKSRFLVRNSWGAAWGQGGYVWLPFQYVLDPALATDFWVVKVVT